jgi:lipopolysaccharide export system protein LptA
MIALVDRDANGQPLAAPQEMSIDWKSNMAFNGVQAHFAGGVDVRSAEHRMKGETLDVQLTHPVSFSNSSSGQPTEIRQVDVKGNVWIELAQYDQQQLISVARLQVPYARIDRQSGELHASGPGRLTTVRAGFRGDWNPAAGSQPTQPDAEAADAKTFLQVDYQREITGNIYRNIVDFWDRVQVVYGPVLSWNEIITTQGPLRKNDVLLSCDRLTVAQTTIGAPSAPSDKRLLDLLAQGNTYVEGQTFTARGERVSYAQSKGLLVLEGTGRTDAVLSHQTRVGASRSETAARKILYWIRTGRAEIADGRLLDLSNLGQ